MTMELGSFGVWQRVGETTPDLVAQAEAMGYGAFWLGGSPKGHLNDVEEALDASERIPVVTGIVNMWREDAETVGVSYLRIAERHPDRFMLGVGIGHPESTREYMKPLDKINDYLDRLERLGVPSGRIVLAALGPRVLKIAAERTAGAHPYFTTPRHTRLAREVVGDGVMLAPEQKVLLDNDVGAAREHGRTAAERYLRLVNYRNNLKREGWTNDDLGNGGSDRLIDEIVLHGEVVDVVGGIRAHLAAGADHVGIQALGQDRVGQYRRLAELLL